MGWLVSERPHIGIKPHGEWMCTSKSINHSKQCEHENVSQHTMKRSLLCMGRRNQFFSRVPEFMPHHHQQIMQIAGEYCKWTIKHSSDTTTYILWLLMFIVQCRCANCQLRLLYPQAQLNGYRRWQGHYVEDISFHHFRTHNIRRRIPDTWWDCEQHFRAVSFQCNNFPEAGWFIRKG